MTLVISCLTEEYAIQVSDRRLTNSRGEVVEDNENKAIDWGGQVAFGYTGLARILSKPTDYWLSEVLLTNTSPLGSISLTDAIENARAKATKDFKRINVKNQEWKRLTIIGVGWVQPFDEIKNKKTLFDMNKNRPVICWISNCLDDKGNILSEPNQEFKTKMILVEQFRYDFLLLAIGQQVSADKLILLRHNIARCLKHKGVGPEPVGRFLVETIRSVSKENITVGSSVMVACIPKSSLIRSRIPMPDGSMGYLVFSSKPQRYNRTFLYVPDGQDEGVNYGPNFVYGGTWLRGFSESKSEVEIRTMRLEPGAKCGIFQSADGTNAHFISPPKRKLRDDYS
jgi:hypothetical protein